MDRLHSFILWPMFIRPSMVRTERSGAEWSGERTVSAQVLIDSLRYCVRMCVFYVEEEEGGTVWLLYRAGGRR